MKKRKKNKLPSQVGSLSELRALRLQSKHELQIKKLEFENSRLKLEKELDPKRISNDITQHLITTFQRTIIGTVLKRFL